MELLEKTQDYLLLIDEEAKSKEFDYYLDSTNSLQRRGSNKYGQGFDDVEKMIYCNHIHKNDKVIIAYYPLTKEVKELDLPLLPNPFEEEIDMISLLDKDIPSCWSSYGKGDGTMSQPEDYNRGHRDSWIKGYKAAQSKQFSLEDMKKAFIAGMEFIAVDPNRYEEDANNYIQSLSTQQLPSEFIPEYDIVHTDHAPNGFEKVLKFKTNSEGKEVLVGTYKY